MSLTLSNATDGLRNPHTSGNTESSPHPSLEHTSPTASTAPHLHPPILLANPLDHLSRLCTPSKRQNRIRAPYAASPSCSPSNRRAGGGAWWWWRRCRRHIIVIIASHRASDIAPARAHPHPQRHLDRHMHPAPPIPRLQHLGRARAGLPRAAGARGVADEVRGCAVAALGPDSALLAELSPEPVGAEQGRVCRARGPGRRQACGARELEEPGRAGQGGWGQGWVEGVSGPCAEVAGSHGCRWDW